eukprot:Skav225217  [mRNA]  locus=scaffold1041:352453:357328:- [translate_table: standard]
MDVAAFPTWRGVSGGEDCAMKDQVKAGETAAEWLVEVLRPRDSTGSVQVRRSEVQRHFRNFGGIEFITLKHKEHRPRIQEQESFCFIGFDSDKAAERAIQEMDRRRTEAALGVATGVQPVENG